MFEKLQNHIIVVDNLKEAKPEAGFPSPFHQFSKASLMLSYAHLSLVGL